MARKFIVFIKKMIFCCCIYLINLYESLISENKFKKKLIPYMHKFLKFII